MINEYNPNVIEINDHTSITMDTEEYKPAGLEGGEYITVIFTVIDTSENPCIKDGKLVIKACSASEMIIANARSLIKMYNNPDKYQKTPDELAAMVDEHIIRYVICSYFLRRLPITPHGFYTINKSLAEAGYNDKERNAVFIVLDAIFTQEEEEEKES